MPLDLWNPWNLDPLYNIDPVTPNCFELAGGLGVMSTLTGIPGAADPTHKDWLYNYTILQLSRITRSTCSWFVCVCFSQYHVFCLKPPTYVYSYFRVEEFSTKRRRRSVGERMQSKTRCNRAAAGGGRYRKIKSRTGRRDKDVWDDNTDAPVTKHGSDVGGEEK